MDPRLSAALHALGSMSRRSIAGDLTPAEERAEYAVECGYGPDEYDPNAMRYVTEAAYERSDRGRDPSLAAILAAYDAPRREQATGYGPKPGADPRSVAGSGISDADLLRMLGAR